MDMTAGLSNAEQRELEIRLNKRQMKDFMANFSSLVDNCFTACVDDFTSKAISGRESGCISRCVLKSMTTQKRLSERFGELNQSMSAEMQNRQ